MVGRCCIILGPMFSGKTSEALRIIRQFRKKSIPVKVFKHSLDIRYDNGTEISSHDRDSEPCTPILNINDIFNDPDYASSQVIIVEEGQFFDKDIIKASRQMVNIDNKYLIIVGLSGDFAMEPIGYPSSSSSCLFPCPSSASSANSSSSEKPSVPDDFCAVPGKL